MVLRTERQTRNRNRWNDDTERRQIAIALDAAADPGTSDTSNDGTAAAMLAPRPLGVDRQTGPNAAGMDSDDVFELWRVRGVSAR